MRNAQVEKLFTRIGAGAVLLSLILFAGPLHAADDAVQKAIKAVEKHRYEEGARDLSQAMQALEQSKQSQAQLALGMLYLRNAELHRELAQASLAVSADHLKRLSAERGGSRSRIAGFYLALVNLESGKGDVASAQLEKFLADGGGDARLKARAKIASGAAAARAGKQEQAKAAWADADTAEPDAKALLAAAFSRGGMTDRNPAALCDEAVMAAKRSGKPLTTTLAAGCLEVYASTGAVDKGADLLARTDLRMPAYRESIGKSKVLSFYDPQLLPALADFYLRAAVSSLEKAAGDASLRGIANYYLGEAYALSGSLDKAAGATAQFLSSAQMPPQYKNRALVRQGAIQYQKGKQTEAIGVWDELSRGQQGNPELLADILDTCGRLRIDCPRLAQTGATSAESGDGKRFMVLNAGLGRYYAGKKDNAKALAYLEAGRDKGNKNKIEANDPLLLVQLAEAYYRTKKFSEALEIYFEMSKQFPQVRQIQEALQGIYSVEHKSAGDVKIN